MAELLRRVNRLFSQRGFWANPLRALAKRAWWRVHWVFSPHPILSRLIDGTPILLPRTGSAALIFYQGYSELDTMDFLRRFLRPGMTFLDIGAHLGEFTLTAAKLVSASGRVFAFEPVPEMFQILSKNILLNQAAHVIADPMVVLDRAGDVQLSVGAEPAEAFVSASPSSASTHGTSTTLFLQSITLDDYLSPFGNLRPDLIKIDVEGAEPLVFRGATRTLSADPGVAPTLWFEHTPATTRFGFDPGEVIQLLADHGYWTFEYEVGGRLLPLRPDTRRRWRSHPNLVATKDATSLARHLLERRGGPLET